MEKVVQLNKGINLNRSFEEQPEGTYRYAQNAVIEEDNGQFSLTTERGKVLQYTFNFSDEEDSGYIVIGSQEVDDNNTVLFLTNDVAGEDIIAIHNDDGVTVLLKENMGFNFNHKIDCVYRLRKGCDRTIYFTDGYNPPRAINIDDITLYYNGATFLPKKLSLFQKGNLQANFNNIEEIEGGDIKPGSYNFALQYIDKDFNSFEFFLVSEPVNIYNDNSSKQYGNIEGSSSKKTFYQNFSNTNKAVQINLTNLDISFPYYRIAIIKSNTGLGVINEVGYSSLISTNNTTFIYSDDTKLFEGSLTEVQQFTNYIATAKHIDTVDNILLLANTTGPDINFGILQKYATKIKVEFTTQSRNIDNIGDIGAITGYGSKRSNIKTDEVSYQFGELYALGIVYVFEDGYESPVYHIPGQSATSTANLSDDNELQTTYQSKGSCGDYWGLDFEGNAILGENVRHHRLPTRQEFGNDLYYTSNGKDYTDFAYLNFTNIQMPTVFEAPTVLGYYIVQAKREDADKLIIDSAILIPTIKSVDEDYISHHVLNNAETGLDKYSERVFAIINPSYKFENKAYSNFNIKHEGYYTIVGNSWLESNTIQDVQAGTSYNPEFHKRRDRDSDGFSLRTLVRDNVLSYSRATTLLNLSTSEVFYLNALESRTIDSGKQVFNLSSDNKIGFIHLDADLSHTALAGKYPYVLLTKPILNQYSDFETRPYYRVNKTINSAVNGSVNNYVSKHGDSFISSMTYSSSVFNDIRVDETRRLKKGVFNYIIAGWSIIAGAMLIALSVVTAGLTALPGVALMSFGVSQLASGISKSNAARVYGDLHDNHLKETISDADISSAFTSLMQDDDGDTDDEIQWFMDILSNVYFESEVNIGLRLGTSLGGTDFLPSPKTRNRGQNTNHLVDKLTVLDQDKTEGRAYLGFCRAEIYEINPDFNRWEREKSHFPLDNTFDFCGTCQEKFPHRIWKSNQSFDEEAFDNFRVFAPNNYKDISGEGGEITDVFIMSNSIFIHTEKILWQQPQNFQERVTSEILSFVGTGEYFNIPPRRMVDAEGFSAGLKINHKWTNVKTPYGVLFLSYGENKWYQFNGAKLKSITDSSMYFKFTELLAEDEESYLYHSAYDREFERVVLTKFGVSTQNNQWSISYNLKLGAITSFHSHIPNFYFSTRQGFYSTQGQSINDFSVIYKHNIPHTYLNLNGVQEDFVIDLICTANPTNNVTWEDLQIYSNTETYNVANQGYVKTQVTFDKIQFYTKSQYSGLLTLVLKEIENYYNTYNISYPEVLCSNSENIWKVNMIRDYVTNYNLPIITNTEVTTLLNENTVDFDKNWGDIQLIRDKYLGIRLTFNTFTDTKLSLNLVKLSFTPSKR